jgi:hypothetical protein
MEATDKKKVEILYQKSVKSYRYEISRLFLRIPILSVLSFQSPQLECSPSIHNHVGCLFHPAVSQEVLESTQNGFNKQRSRIITAISIVDYISACSSYRE